MSVHTATSEQLVELLSLSDVDELISTAHTARGMLFHPTRYGDWIKCHGHKEWTFKDDLKEQGCNTCHICGCTCASADAALCISCGLKADRGEVVYDPNEGWLLRVRGHLPSHGRLHHAASHTLSAGVAGSQSHQGQHRPRCTS